MNSRSLGYTAYSIEEPHAGSVTVCNRVTVLVWLLFVTIAYYGMDNAIVMHSYAWYH
jgi:hypothetical protein